MSLLQYPIQAPNKFREVQGVNDAHYKVNFGRMLGEGTLHDYNPFVRDQEKLTKCKYIEKSPPYPPFGLNQVKDILGMGTSVDMIMQSLDTGTLITFA